MHVWTKTSNEKTMDNNSASVGSLAHINIAQNMWLLYKNNDTQLLTYAF